MVNDILGVQMIYPTKTGGQQHYLQTHNQSDISIWISSGQTPFWGFTVGNTKAFSIAHGHNTAVDLSWETTAGFDDLSTQDHSLAKTRGYFEDPVDFRNAEISMYMFASVVDADSTSDLRLRYGGRPSTTTDCRAAGYFGKLNWSTAVVSFGKQKNGGTWFIWPSTANAGTGNIEDKWVGTKFMCYNIDSQGRPQFDGPRVKVEYWVDKLNNNVWTKVFEVTDTGSNWGTNETGAFPTCALNPITPITWGGPHAIWGHAGCQQNEPSAFGDFSVREIDPGMPPDPSGPPPTGGGEVPPPPVAQVTISKQFTDMFHVAQNAGESCDVSGEVTPLPFSELWNVSPTTPAAYTDLYNGSITRAGIMCRSASILNNMQFKEITVIVRKEGAPTGTLNIGVYDVNQTSGAATFKRQFGTMNVDVATLVANTDTSITFVAPNETIRVGGGNGNAFCLGFVAGSSTAKIRAKFAGVDALDGANTNWITSINGTTFTQDTAKDAPWRIEGYT